MKNAKTQLIKTLATLNLDQALAKELEISQRRISKEESQIPEYGRKNSSDKLPGGVERVILRHEAWEAKNPHRKTIMDYEVKEIFDPFSPDILKDLQLIDDNQSLHPDYNLSKSLATVEKVFENVELDDISLEFTKLGFFYILLKADNMGLLNPKGLDLVW